MCIEMHRCRTPPEDPPCKGSEENNYVPCRVDPYPENEDALRVWFGVRHQFRMGMNGPIDIDHLAVDAAMKRENVHGKKCFEKIIKLSQWYIARSREEK